MKQVPCTRIILIAFIFTVFISAAEAQDVTTYAGTPGVSGFLDGAAAVSKFNSPHGICTDKQGNVYVADRYNHRIRKISMSGVVSTFAGTGIPGSTDGPGASATFQEPWAVACDTLGNLYVADTKNYKIRKITPAAVVSTVAGTGSFGTTNGPVATAQFGFPAGIAVKADGTIIYVADRMTHVIRKIEAGQVSTLAGSVFTPGSANGTGTAAQFDHPYSIILDLNGNILVADEWNNKIRKVTPAGAVTTVAGSGSAGSLNGNATVATFNAPWCVATDSIGNIYVGDGNNFTIRKISTLGVVSDYAGITGMPGYSNGSVNTATFSGVTALAYFKPLHSLFVADAYNQLIRKVAPVSTVQISITSNSANNSFCSGASVILTASPGGLTNYVFMEGSTVLGNSSNGVFTISTLAVGIHTIYCTAQDGLGYTIVSDPITITILSGTSASITPSGTVSFCQGDSIQLVASAGLSYLWNTSATTQTIYAKSAGQYSVTVTAAGGCTAQAPPVTVVMNLYPVSVQVLNDTICPGEHALVSVVQQPGVAYYWYAQPSGGTLLYAGINFQTPALNQSASYYVELHGSNGCINPVRSAVYALVIPRPASSFEYSLPASTAGGLEVLFQNTTVSAASFWWDFGDPVSPDNNSILENPTHTYAEPGDYLITLASGNSLGCMDTLRRTIRVARSNSIFIPNAFTPNNDGSNDIFRVRGNNLKNVSMHIFNQWGEMIYDSAINFWDGKVKGDVVQNGTYAYWIEVEYENGDSEKFKGQVTVIR